MLASFKCSCEKDKQDSANARISIWYFQEEENVTLAYWKIVLFLTFSFWTFMILYWFMIQYKIMKDRKL